MLPHADFSWQSCCRKKKLYIGGLVLTYPPAPAVSRLSSQRRLAQPLRRGTAANDNGGPAPVNSYAPTRPSGRRRLPEDSWRATTAAKFLRRKRIRIRQWLHVIGCANRADTPILAYTVHATCVAVRMATRSGRSLRLRESQAMVIGSITPMTKKANEATNAPTNEPTPTEADSALRRLPIMSPGLRLTPKRQVRTDTCKLRSPQRRTTKILNRIRRANKKPRRTVTLPTTRNTTLLLRRKLTAPPRSQR